MTAARLVEGADEVLGPRVVDADLAADGAVHHGQQRGGHADPVHAAHVGGGGEAGHVADHAAAEGDHQAVAAEARAPGRRRAALERARRLLWRSPSGDQDPRARQARRRARGAPVRRQTRGLDTTARRRRTAQGAPRRSPRAPARHAHGSARRSDGRSSTRDLRAWERGAYHPAPPRPALVSAQPARQGALRGGRAPRGGPPRRGCGPPGRRAGAAWPSGASLASGRGRGVPASRRPPRPPAPPAPRCARAGRRCARARGSHALAQAVRLARASRTRRSCRAGRRAPRVDGGRRRARSRRESTPVSSRRGETRSRSSLVYDGRPASSRRRGGPSRGEQPAGTRPEKPATTSTTPFRERRGRRRRGPRGQADAYHRRRAPRKQDRGSRPADRIDALIPRDPGMSDDVMRADFLVLGLRHRRPAGGPGAGPPRPGARGDQGPAHGEQHRLRAGRGGGGHGASDDATDLHLEDTLQGGRRASSPSRRRACWWRRARSGSASSPPGARASTARPGRLHFTREGAHSRNRVLHALGDATGWEMVRALLERDAAHARASRVRVVLLLDRPRDRRTARVVGCRFLDEDGERDRWCWRAATLLATGGAGQVFAETTNPPVATGDGVAMAWRAGAALLDMEFVQFHPTALAVEGAPRFLVSEAVRGEGALPAQRARASASRRSWPPRDQVARAIAREAAAGRGPVTLDLRHLDPERVRTRFPRIHATCARYGIDITRDPDPGDAGRPLRHGRRGHRPPRPLHAPRPLRGGRGGGHRRPRREPPGQQLAARGAGLRRARRGGHGRRTRSPRPPRDAAGAAAGERRGRGGRPSPRDELRRRAWDALGLERDARRPARAARATSTTLRRRVAAARRTARPPRTANLVDVALGHGGLARSSARRAAGGHFRTDFPHTDDAPVPRPHPARGRRRASRRRRASPLAGERLLHAVATRPTTSGPLFPFAEYWWFYAGVHRPSSCVLLALDLGVFHRKAHAVSFKEAATWSVVWVTLALALQLRPLPVHAAPVRRTTRG